MSRTLGARQSFRLGKGGLSKGTWNKESGAKLESPEQKIKSAGA